MAQAEEESKIRAQSPDDLPVLSRSGDFRSACCCGAPCDMTWVEVRKQGGQLTKRSNEERLPLQTGSGGLAAEQDTPHLQTSQTQHDPLAGMVGSLVTQAQ